jgi:alpha-ketoglutaric semialdehyde dehydrogenase
MFAQLVRDGRHLDLRIDPADPARTPPRVDLRLRNIPLGPVAVFGSSNFPLAFSVAGGDTASALAAGAPVVAKAHPAHPGTSELVGRAVAKAVADAGLPSGVFSMLFDAGYEIGTGLVADPRIKGVGFTGSRKGGLALIDVAQKRKEPIPVYAEMSSINPVILMPSRTGARISPRPSSRRSRWARASSAPIRGWCSQSTVLRWTGSSPSRPPNSSACRLSRC